MKLSILGLMGWIVAIAVAFTALRSANTWWAGGVLLATLTLLGFAALRAILGQGRTRAAWLGILVFGGGYFLAIRTLPEQEAALLPTVQLVQFVQSRVAKGQFFTLTLMPPGNTTSVATAVSPNRYRFRNSESTPSWTTVLPGAANGAAFRSIVHNLFALLAGWIGALVARRMWRE